MKIDEITIGQGTQYGAFPESYLLILISLFEELGGNEATLLQIFNKKSTEELIKDNEVDALTFVALILAAKEQLNKPAFGLLLGQQLSLPSHGELGTALLCCKNLEQTIIIMIKYMAVISNLININFSLDPTPALRLSLDENDEIPELEQLQTLSFKHTIVDLFFSCFCKTLTDLFPSHDLGLEITLQFDKPLYFDCYQSVLGITPQFNCPNNQFSISKELFKQNMPMGNPALLVAQEKKLQTILASRVNNSPFSTQVKNLILRSEGDLRTRDSLAEVVNMSPRTFSRRLQEEGTTFLRILNDAQMEMALGYLDNSSLTIQEIAFQLKFTDASNFRRSFIKWTGTSPASYRRLKTRK